MPWDRLSLYVLSYCAFSFAYPAFKRTAEQPTSLALAFPCKLPLQLRLMLIFNLKWCALACSWLRVIHLWVGVILSSKQPTGWKKPYVTKIYHKYWKQCTDSLFVVLSVWGQLRSAGVSDLIPCKTLLIISIKNPHSFPVGCFLCYSINTEQSPLSRTQRQAQAQASNHKLQTKDTGRDMENSNLGSFLIQLILEEVCDFIAQCDAGVCFCTSDVTFSAFNQLSREWFSSFSQRQPSSKSTVNAVFWDFTLQAKNSVSFNNSSNGSLVNFYSTPVALRATWLWGGEPERILHPSP